MAIMQMQRIQICALKKDRKKILELLQRRGIVEIDERIEPDALVTKTDTSQTSAVFAKNAAAAAEALRVLQEYAPEKNSMLSSLEGKSVETVATYNAFYKVSHAVTDIALRIVQLQRAIAEKKGEAAKLRGQIQALVPWLGLDAPLNYDGTRAVKAFVGYFPMETELSELLTRLAEQDPELPPVHVEIVGHALNQTLVFVLCRREQGKQVESALRGLGFSYPPVSAGKPPKERIDEIKDEIRACEDGIAADEKELLDYVPRREDLKFAVDYFNMRKEKYEVLGRLSQTKHAFFITGYIPMRAADAIARELAEAYGAHVEISDLEPDEERPVLLRNNKFAAPVEGVVESFGLPKRGEIDPCSITAFFYYILFGLMFSDAAYGIIMVFVCAFALIRFKNMSPSMHNSVLLFLYCGLSTIFWGLMFGGFFGDFLEVVSTTFFNTSWKTPTLWFNIMDALMQMLVFCMLLGLIHLYAGLAIQFYQLMRQKRYKDAVYDVVFWFGLVTGLVFILLDSALFQGIAQMEFHIPPVVVTVSSVVAAVCAVGIIATSGRESRGIKRFLKGLYGLYGITSWLGDVLSYSRLMALGLATSVVGSVVNQMASMKGNGVVGVIMFIVIFLLGHTLNFGINVLGAYVHTNRLQYVEFFGKFYEGGGRRFSPFQINSKYYSIKEDSNNG